MNRDIFSIKRITPAIQISPSAAWKLQKALDCLTACLWDIYETEFMHRCSGEDENRARAHDEADNLGLPF